MYSHDQASAGISLGFTSMILLNMRWRTVPETGGATASAISSQPSLHRIEALAKLLRGQLLAIERAALREILCPLERSHDDGIETGIVDEHRGRVECFLVVARQRNGHAFAGPVRFRGKELVAHGVERTDDASAGQIFRRRYADAFLVHFLGDIAVPSGDRIAGVEHYLAGKLAAVILSDLRIGAVRHRDEDDIAEGDGVRDRAAL